MGFCLRQVGNDSSEDRLAAVFLQIYSAVLFPPGSYPLAATRSQFSGLGTLAIAFK